MLTASRALVAVAARSLAAANDEVTLSQYRALVVLASRGPQSMVGLAELLDLHPSSTSRLCDRLVAKHLVRREQSTASRREVTVDLLPAGRRLVGRVTARRRTEIEAIVGRVPSELRASVIAALGAFADAAGEVPEQAWSMGWS